MDTTAHITWRMKHRNTYSLGVGYIRTFFCVKLRLLFLINAVHDPSQNPDLILQRGNSLVGAIAPRHAFQTRWRHQMGIFSALLDLYVGNSPVTDDFPSQRPVRRSFDVFIFNLRLNKRLSKESWGWLFETLSFPLWCHCNGQLGKAWMYDASEYLAGGHFAEEVFMFRNDSKMNCNYHPNAVYCIVVFCNKILHSTCRYLYLPVCLYIGVCIIFFS